MILIKLFWNILMSDQISLSPQVKQSVIISNKHGTCKLSSAYRPLTINTDPEVADPSNNSPRAQRAIPAPLNPTKTSPADPSHTTEKSWNRKPAPTPHQTQTTQAILHHIENSKIDDSKITTIWKPQAISNH